jgi:replicative DNA helicase
MTEPSAPQNQSAEQAILGAILLAHKIPAACHDLQPTHFYREDHGLIFNVLRGMDAIDTLLLVAELRSRGLLEKAGGQAAVDLLAACVPNAAHLPFYVKEVRAMAELREVIAACRAMLDAAYAHDWPTIERGRAWFRGEKPNVIPLRRAA